MSSTDKTSRRRRGGSYFSTTQWSLVLAAGDSRHPNSREALAELCRLYWRPVFGYVRSRSRDADTAADLTQAFFAHLMEKRSLKAANPERGRFRSFLLASVKNFLANDNQHARAQKRGGGRDPIPLEVEAGELRPIEDSELRNPEQAYQRQWALIQLERALQGLQNEMDEAGHRWRFRRLSPFLAGGSRHGSLKQVAVELDMSESAARTALHRMRRRFGELLRAVIAETVLEPKAVADEIRFLFKVLDRH